MADSGIFESVKTLLVEHADLQEQLADPELHSNPAKSKKVNRRYAELSRIVDAYNRWIALTDDFEAATEMAADDASFAEELPNIKAELDVMEERLRRLLIPRDPNDGRDVIMEIKMGEGGAESALFAGDLLRMYLHYAESKRWKTEIIEQTSSDLGGIKDVQLAIKGNSTDPAEGVWAHLKYEGGVHRVQRVPATESQGRIHTSAAGVLVFPEVDEPEEVEISQNDLKIDVYRSSGPGGQSVNTTYSAVRLTHLPSGLVAQCQDQKSQLKNFDKALAVLRSRVYDMELAKKNEADGLVRKSMIGGGDRSDKIRTYNYPQGRVTDHRIGYTVYNLASVMEGNVDDFVEQLRIAESAERLQEGVTK